MWCVSECVCVSLKIQKSDLNIFKIRVILERFIEANRIPTQHLKALLCASPPVIPLDTLAKRAT